MPYHDMPFKNKQAAKADRNGGYKFGTPKDVASPKEPTIGKTGLTGSEVDKAMKAFGEHSKGAYTPGSQKMSDVSSAYAKSGKSVGGDPNKRMREAAAYVADVKRRDPSGYKDIVGKYEVKKRREARK